MASRNLATQPQDMGKSFPITRSTLENFETAKSNPFFNIRPHNRTAGWVNEPDIPTSKEVAEASTGDAALQHQLEPNIVDRPWPTASHYLKTQYALLREDGIGPLRQCVDEVRAYPDIEEAQSQYKTRIYESVYIIEVTVHQKGLAFKVEFNTRRSGKRVCWPISPRLKSGSAVALTPANDGFKTICKIAIVAARPLQDLDIESPGKPAIHIEFGDPREIEIDPQLEWLMVEAPRGYWEATRHTLVALQKMNAENIPLANHLLSLETNVKAPSYTDIETLRMLAADANEEQLRDNGHGLDKSQLAALDRILTKSLAIVQGPPGTGKTYVSVMALRLLLSTSRGREGPIIVTAHTNHALDQLLRHIAKFDAEFVRLGGQSSDQEIITPRTLPVLREKGPKIRKSSRAEPLSIQKQVNEELEKAISALSLDVPISLELIEKHALLNEAQCRAIERADNDWSECFNGSDDPMSNFCMDQISPFKKHGEDFYASAWEDNDDVNQLQGADGEMKVGLEGERFEDLHGKFYQFHPGFASKFEKYSEARISCILEKYGSNLDAIPEKYRGSFYDVLRQRLVYHIRDRIRAIACNCKRMAKLFQVARWENDVQLLMNTNIIGLTTTGISKYRPLVKALKPKIILVEEAAETLEPSVTAAFMPSVEHVILVGDHQQLRGRCNLPQLEGHPYYLDVSMFERLVQSNVEFTRLQLQRRMRPEIREILKPIYPDLTDHPSVQERNNVKGMGGINLCFVNHNFPEASDDQLSKQNFDEALLAVAFCKYLTENGISSNRITLLTFYNGQRKLLLRLISKYNIPECRIATVDSFQGEESDIVVLSLVRCNNERSIGFLSVANRVCVALSRARNGLYIFGHMRDIYQRNPLWKEVLKVMESSQALFSGLPITCRNHNRLTWIYDGSELQDLDGGCGKQCAEKMPCGHLCRLKCHPIPHERLQCQEPCPASLACGHSCKGICGDSKHRCGTCTDPGDEKLILSNKKHIFGSSIIAPVQPQKLSHRLTLSAQRSGPSSAKDEVPDARSTVGNKGVYQYDDRNLQNGESRVLNSTFGDQYHKQLMNPHGLSHKVGIDEATQTVRLAERQEEIEKMAVEVARKYAEKAGCATAALDELTKSMAKTTLDPVSENNSPHQRHRWIDEWVNPSVIERAVELLKEFVRREQVQTETKNFLD